MLFRNLKSVSFIIVFCLVLSQKQFAQEIKFKHITVENGLSNNKVNCLLSDHYGFVWFGTEDGLSRFDGYEIKIYRHQADNQSSISSNGISSLFEDKDGHIWIGTKEGEINRYDPKKDRFDSWRLDSSSTNENRVFSFFQDDDRKLWIATYRTGLYQFDQKKNRFINWQYDPKNENSLSNNFVSGIIKDKKGNYWISTYNGLNRLEFSSGKYKFTRFYSNANINTSISNNLIWNLIPVNSEPDKFWVCTINGVDIFNALNFNLEHFPIPKENKSQFDASACSIIEENTIKGKVYWVGTYNGLLRINVQDNIYKRYLNDEDNIESITSNQINALLQDNSGVIWIATEDGINYISPKELRFTQYYSRKKISKSFEELRKNNITAICESENGNVWIGTDKGLFNFNNPDENEDLDVNSKFLDLNVWALCRDKSKKIWIGTYGQGLKKIDLKTKSIVSIPIKSKINLPSFYRYVKSIMKDNDGNLWIGYWGSGLIKYNPDKDEFSSWINDENSSNSLSYNDIWSLYEDSKENIWVGTYGGGLNLYNKENETFYRLLSSSKNKTGLSSNSIYSICESKNSKQKVNDNLIILWLGTSKGLNKLIIDNSDRVDNLNQIKAKIKVYTINEGLSDNSVKSITEDNDGKLWLGTANGLSQFDPETEKFINYSNSDGLSGNNFNFTSSYLTKDGSILLGGVKGLNIFKPNEISQLPYSPPVYLTDFQLLNKSVNIGEDSPININVAFINEINLGYDQNIFSFRFTALDFNSPQSIQYAYKLEGFDTNWIYSGKRRYAAYTNLNPGIYYFHVKGTNSDGLWVNNIKSVKIIINSPWWKTDWAFSAYLLIIVMGLIGIRKFELNRTKLRNELKMREFEAHKLREIENVKSRFFANLSHEFRTPLMLIKGPIEQLRSNNFHGDVKKHYGLIYRNAEKLHTLIDQLLELTQLESESIPLKARKENIVIQLRGIFYSFNSIAQQKDIKIEFFSEFKSICAWVDKDKLEKIINNILSNAFKFTPTKGTIRLFIETSNVNNQKFAVIKIADNGIGIPKEKQSKIFDRFYQADDSSERVFGGSGIGLSLVKELVELHRWEIEVESEEFKGTTFIITVPMSEDYLDQNQKMLDESSNIKSAVQKKTGILNDENINNKKANENAHIKNAELSNDVINYNNSLSIVLVVEDSDDVREYIKSLLEKEFNIMEAHNGEEGLKILKDNEIEIVISDIMMPVMDGIEFCKQIKSDFVTSHLPVILLTAKASQESKIEGLETGADDYISKPFNSKEFIARVKNILDQRKRLREKFSKEIIFQPEAVTVNSLDKRFLEKSLSVVEANIFNQNFDLEMFAKEMFLSRSQLHRKMIAITGQAPGEFIRIFKLKKAAQLILEKRLSVTQIALEVGFNSPSHFTKAFQQYFNCLPSEFVEKSQINNTIK